MSATSLGTARDRSLRTRPKPVPAGRDQRQTGIAAAVCLALGLAVAVLYARTASFDFIGLDDYFVVVDRPEVNAGLTMRGVRWAFTTLEPDWQPLTSMSHMLVFTAFGGDPGSHHLVNVALHALTAILLFLALRLLTGDLWPSALVAALFAVHPLRVESVAWVTERKDTLSGVFWMLTLLAYGWYARRPGVGRYAAVFAAFGLGLMCKPMLVTLPLILLLLDFWPLRRWPGGDVDGRLRLLFTLAAEKVPLLLLAVGVALTTVASISSQNGLRSFDAISFGWRLALPPLAYATYILQSLWPAGLAVMYPHPALIGSPLSTLAWEAGGAATVLLGISLLCALTWRTRPYLAVGWLWFLVALVPVIGVVQAGSQWHADRFTYTATIGLAILLAWALRDLVVQRPGLLAPIVAAALAALLALGLTARHQVETWQSSTTLFQHALAVTEDNYFAHQVLGGTLLDQGDLDGARRHLEEAVRIRPDESFAHERLGTLLRQQGDEAGAERQYEEALRLDPVSAAQSRREIFAKRLAQGRLEEAAALLEGPGTARTTDANMRLALGKKLLQLGRTAEGLSQIERAVASDPESAVAHNELGVALAGQRRWAEAAAQFEKSLALDPLYRPAQLNLTFVRQQTGAP